MKKITEKEHENARIMRQFATNIIKIGATIEGVEYETLEPYMIFNLDGSRYSVSCQSNNIFAHADTTINNYTTILTIPHESETLESFLTCVFDYLGERQIELSKQVWCRKFNHYIDTLSQKHPLTPVMEHLACDVAVNLTEYQIEMNLDNVIAYFVNDVLFVNALSLGEDRMRRELDIDFDDVDAVAEYTSVYCCEVVIPSFNEQLSKQTVQTAIQSTVATFLHKTDQINPIKENEVL